ncbi:MAG: type I polyketide synthase [Gammaproteobacteria bacterium]|nr:type I polyketide synthase [Gammaproteobacteria bacterium]MCP5195226.1 type I polyketide synthase [Gammaproteobacteria bacterium]
MNPLDTTDIAIIGMAGLFPKAPDAPTYWANILNRVDAMDEPLPEWGAELYYDPASDEPTRLYTRRGGFLRELSRFNPQPFGIMPVSTAGGEPDQFHALELAKAALIDAGLTEKTYDPEAIGIILGHGTHPNRANMTGAQHALFLDQQVGLLQSLWPTLEPMALQRLRDWLKRRLPPFDIDNIPGLVPNMMTGRIANRLNFMGPNYVLDAACASSLIAVEAAMLELRRGRVDIMLTGGINTSTSPLVFMIFCMLGALSPTAQIRPFSNAANGTMLGEGGGVLVLRRLEDARRDGQRIYAILKSVGQSSDGRAKGLTAPRLEGELLAMQRTYRQAGIDPTTLGLIEAHGTGIPLGDRTETQALLQLLGERQRVLPHIALGSVKSMIGHCIPAAGIAGLIKTALALHHKILPPTLCEEVSSELGLERTPLYVNTEARPWIQGGPTPRRAAVNAFGFGGVNSHALLEEDPQGGEMPLAAFLPAPLRRHGEVLVFKAPDREALRQQAHRVMQRWEAQPEWPLAEVASELWRRQEAGDMRLAVVAAQREEALGKLEQAMRKLVESQQANWQTRNGLYFCAEPVGGPPAFLFPGENSQYMDMFRALALEFPSVRRWFDFLDGLFREERDIAPGEAIFPPPTGLNAGQRQALEERLSGMELGSESVFVAGRAMDALLRQFGIQPGFLLGHSTGENDALMASGLFQLSETQLGECVRGMNQRYRALLEAGELPPGVLLSVSGMPLEQVRALVEVDERLFVTLDNCAHQFILFGPEEAITAVHARLRQEGAFCVRLPMGHGYHTPLMEPMAQAFRRLFESVAIGPPAGRVYSCVAAAPFPTDAAAARDLAAAQYRLPVRFRESIERLYADGARLFVEVGPSAHLIGFVRDSLRGRPHVAVASDDPRRADLTPFQQLLAVLFVQGVALNLEPWPDRSAPPSKPAPYLSSALPFIQLPEDEAAQVREWLTVAPTSSATVSPPRLEKTSNTTAPLTLDQRPKAHAPVQRQAALEGHFSLMQDFLQQQERVMSAWLSRRRH